jgi:Zn-finger nucleic acid-binding protein
MDCAVCKNAMVVLELQQVEVDHCFACGGIWLDAGELELLIDDPTRSMELLESFEVDTTFTEAKRRCPICHKKMEKVIVGHEKPQLLIDRCRKKHGLWFDAGELPDVLERARLDSQSRIQQLLAEIFAKAKPRNNKEPTNEDE